MQNLKKPTFRCVLMLDLPGFKQNPCPHLNQILALWRMNLALESLLGEFNIARINGVDWESQFFRQQANVTNMAGTSFLEAGEAPSRMLFAPVDVEAKFAQGGVTSWTECGFPFGNIAALVGSFSRPDKLLWPLLGPEFSTSATGNTHGLDSLIAAFDQQSKPLFGAWNLKVWQECCAAKFGCVHIEARGKPSNIRVVTFHGLGAKRRNDIKVNSSSIIVQRGCCGNQKWVACPTQEHLVLVVELIQDCGALRHGENGDLIQPGMMSEVFGVKLMRSGNRRMRKASPDGEWTGEWTGGWQSQVITS